jgi:hypothetical protein
MERDVFFHGIAKTVGTKQAIHHPRRRSIGTDHRWAPLIVILKGEARWVWSLWVRPGSVAPCLNQTRMLDLAFLSMKIVNEYTCWQQL